MKPIVQLNEFGEVIKAFKSVKECADYFKCKDDTISRIVANPSRKTLLRLRGLNLKFKAKNDFEFDNLPFEKEDLIKLIGWYLSDGCATFYKNKDVKEIRISQIKNGKLYDEMNLFYY